MPALKLKVINKKTLADLNTLLDRLQGVYDTVCQAQAAGIPEMDGVKISCMDLKAKIDKFKAIYFQTEI